MPQAPLIAADTNVLLGYAAKDETVMDCFDLLRRRLLGSRVLVPPTVLQELVYLITGGDTARAREAAGTALRRLVHPWGFQPVNFVPVGHGIAERIAQALRGGGLIPAAEMNDSFIVAEAGLLNISILLSTDSHLTDIPHAALRLAMDAADVRAPLIASPWKIVHQFFRG